MGLKLFEAGQGRFQERKDPKEKVNIFINFDVKPPIK